MSDFAVSSSVLKRGSKYLRVTRSEVCKASRMASASALACASGAPAFVRRSENFRVSKAIAVIVGECSMRLWFCQVACFNLRTDPEKPTLKSPADNLEG